MFGGILQFNNPVGTDLGEQMLNTVATQAIRHLFTQSKSVDVSIRCFPSSKLLQGNIDSFCMTGRGLTIRRQFDVEEMSFQTDAVSIDVGSAITGQIQLKQPTQAVAQIVLTEEAINRAFGADLVEKRLQNLDNEELTQLSGGEPVSFQDVWVRLLPENQVKISAKVQLSNGLVPIALTAKLGVEKRRQIVFQQPQFDAAAIPEEKRGLSEILTQAFVRILDNMVDLDRFDLDGTTLRINRLETHDRKLVFSGYAQIEHFPKVG